MDVDAFVASVLADGVRLRLPSVGAPPERAPEKVDALFHLPLLALAIMVVARQSPFRTAVVGHSVALLLVEHFVALRHSPHGLETSLTLRRRCADALAFLEAAELVTVEEEGQRTVALTPNGKNHLDRTGRDATDLGLLIRQLRISQERVRARVGNDER